MRSQSDFEVALQFREALSPEGRQERLHGAFGTETVPMIFDNRQLAVLILLAALLTTALIASRGVRSSVKDLGKQLASPKLFTPFLVYGLWLAGLHWVFWRFGLWNFKLLGDSIFWVGITGLALLTLAATDAGKRDSFFRHKAISTVKFGLRPEAPLDPQSLLRK